MKKSARYLLEKFLLQFRWRSYTASQCGHKTKRRAEITAFGDRVVVTLPFVKGAPEYCHSCLEKMAIPCAWCGKAIFPIGDPVTLCTPREPNYTPPPQAVVYSKDLIVLVGCLRWDCADNGAFRSGFWVVPGTVRRVSSPLEISLATGAGVFVNDYFDQNEVPSVVPLAKEKV